MAEGKSKAQETWVHHPFDKASRYAVAVHPQGLLNWLEPNFEPHFRFIRWAPVRGQVDPDAADRVGDTVAQLLDLKNPDQPVAVPIEIQTVAESLTIFRLLRYAAIFSHLLRGKDHRSCDIHPAVIHLTGGIEVKSIDSFRDGLNSGLRLNVISRSMRDEDAETLLTQIDNEEVHWCMLYWVSLMQGAERTDIIIKWKGLAERFIPGEERRNLAVVALTFSELQGRLEIWRANLKEWPVIESKLHKEWYQDAELRGRLAGKSEGELLMARSTLTTVLETKFGEPVPPDLAVAIAAQDDPAVLSQWLRESITAASVDEVRKRMGPALPQPTSQSDASTNNGGAKPPAPAKG